MENMTRGT